jgi:hypothetical protein
MCWHAPIASTIWGFQERRDFGRGRRIIEISQARELTHLRCGAGSHGSSLLRSARCGTPFGPLRTFSAVFAGLCACPKPCKKCLKDSLTLPAGDAAFRRLNKNHDASGFQRLAGFVFAFSRIPSARRQARVRKAYRPAGRQAARSLPSTMANGRPTVSGNSIATSKLMIEPATASIMASRRLPNAAAIAGTA